jgi:hypothetical protein
MWHLTPQYKEIWKKKQICWFFKKNSRPRCWILVTTRLGSVHRYYFFKNNRKKKKINRWTTKKKKFLFFFFLLPKIRRHKNQKLSIVCLLLKLFFFSLVYRFQSTGYCTRYTTENSFPRYEGQRWWTVFSSKNKHGSILKKNIKSKWNVLEKMLVNSCLQDSL